MTQDEGLSMFTKFQAVGSHEAGDVIDAPIRVVGHQGTPGKGDRSLTVLSKCE